MMRPSLVLILAVLPLCATAAFKQDAIVFSTGLGQNPVQVTFNGRQFDPPIEVQQDRIVGDRDVRPIYEMLAKMIVANQAGDWDAVLPLWLPDERETLRRQTDADVFERNTDQFRALEQVQLRAVMLYGNYTICFVTYVFDASTRLPLQVVMTERGGTWYLTNGLTGDWFYDQVSHLLLEPGK